MPYTPDKPRLSESSDELRARIPGWGADLDPGDRPSYPREQFQADLTGAHWEVPERQPERWPRERSIEHQMLTPVFGTATPPRGVSGAIRKYAYANFSEARAAHWLILMAADRVDSKGSTLRSFLTLRPDNPVTETGVLSEFTRHGLASRRGSRVDVVHHPLDAVIVGGPWVLSAWLGWRSGSRIVRRIRGRAHPTG